MSDWSHIDQIRDGSYNASRQIAVRLSGRTNHQRPAVVGFPRANLDSFLAGGDHRRPRLTDRQSLHGSYPPGSHFMPSNIAVNGVEK